MECKKDVNMQHCNCSAPCGIKGVCCDCIKKHREKNQLPGCYFSTKGEATWDRSVENFINDYQSKQNYNPSSVAVCHVF